MEKYLPVEWQFDIQHLKNLASYKQKQSSITERIGSANKKYVYTLRDFRDEQVIFIDIPKAADESVNAALLRHRGGGHKTVRKYRKIFGRKFWLYYKFTFTSNPYSRLVSAYEYLRKGGYPAWPSNRRFNTEVIQSFNGFSDFVLHWIRPDKANWLLPHFCPQVHFLELDGELAVDFMGSVEAIEKDFVVVCEKLGKKVPLLKKDTAYWRRKLLPSYYENDSVLRRVKEVYAADFKSLGYSTDIEKASEPPKTDENNFIKIV